MGAEDAPERCPEPRRRAGEQVFGAPEREADLTPREALRAVRRHHVARLHGP